MTADLAPADLRPIRFSGSPRERAALPDSFPLKPIVLTGDGRLRSCPYGVADAALKGGLDAPAWWVWRGEGLGRPTLWGFVL